MSLVDVQNLSFAYEGSSDSVFHNVSFRLDTDWRLAFTGRNGRGKTTFCRILMGELKYQGRITAKTDFAYFPYPVTDEEEDTLTVLQKACPQAPEWQLIRELRLLGIGEEELRRPFFTLSGGEKTRSLLAPLFLRENCYPLIDEPTNHLDLEGRRIVSRYLAGRNSGFLLISHDRLFLEGCTDHVLSIGPSTIQIHQGSFSAWLQDKARQDQFEQEKNRQLEKEIGRLKKTAREKSDWADRAEGRKIGFDPKVTEKSMGRRAYEGAKSKKSMKRAKAISARIESSIEEKSALLKDIERNEALKLTPCGDISGALVTLRNAAVRYGALTVGKPVSLELHRGERVALIGKNGCGKTSLMRLICGGVQAHDGFVELSPRLAVSYVPQESARLRGGLSAFAEERGIDRTRFLTILRKFGFERVQFEKDMENFSAGQRKKVFLAASLCESAHLYIWDEPLNYIDLISRMQIEELILEYQPTMLFTEHDAAFTQKVATRTVTLG